MLTVLVRLVAMRMKMSTAVRAVCFFGLGGFGEDGVAMSGSWMGGGDGGEL